MDSQPFKSAAEHRALPVVVFAPYGDDAAVIAQALNEDQVVTMPCEDAGGLQTQSEDIVGLFLLSQEALTQDCMDILREILDAQERWSEIPIIVLLDERMQVETVRNELVNRLQGSKLFILHRPLRKVELNSVVHSALRARARQFAVDRYIAVQQELRRELNHRVKNILATVHAIYAMTQRRNDDLKGFAQEFEGRLDSLNTVHDALFAENANALHVRKIVEGTVSPVRFSGDRIKLSGPRMQIGADAATMFALAVHELLTNALKYGALSQEKGVVNIRWYIEPEDCDELVFEWLESGGPAVAKPKRNGYGTAFIRNVFENRFSGSMRFQYPPEGLRAELRGRIERMKAPVTSL